MLANLELSLVRSRWRVHELKARFNAQPEPELVDQVNSWVAGLPQHRVLPEPRPARLTR